MEEKYAFYTVLFIKDDDFNRIVSENGFSNVRDYIRCCAALNNSLMNFGYKITVLTNRPEIIAQVDRSLNVEKIPFSLNVPGDIKFFAAHHKIDAFGFLAQKNNQYSILLDNDIICINDMPENLFSVMRQNIPVYYDITDQTYPAYGRKRIIDDKSLLMGEDSAGIWAGGEFIAGDALFWNDIYQLCMKYWDVYAKNYKSLHHQGDEMLLSCAIEKYQKNNNIINAACFGAVARHWSVKTLHFAKPLDALYDIFLIHLPNDKLFFANYKNKDFKREYKKYLRHKNIFKKIKNYLNAIKNSGANNVL